MLDYSFCYIYTFLKHFLYDLAFRKHFSCRFELKFRYRSWIHYSRKTSTKCRESKLLFLTLWVTSGPSWLQWCGSSHSSDVLGRQFLSSQMLQLKFYSVITCLLFISYYFVANCCLKNLLRDWNFNIRTQCIIEGMRKSENFYQTSVILE